MKLLNDDVGEVAASDDTPGLLERNLSALVNPLESDEDEETSRKRPWMLSSPGVASLHVHSCLPAKMEDEQASPPQCWELGFHMGCHMGSERAPATSYW